ncbi:MAG: RNA 2',3'-cyclic phosphodiesterase [Robiginitomaculum sp.]|nr:MAG: RNA 2',3'-cyclic phosphodiesterase [Robiginitomaculum sp.]
MPTYFAAIKLSEDILDAIEPLQKGIEGVNWSPRDNLHITIGYFGELSDEYVKMLDRELARSPGFGFDVSLSGVDYFGSSRPHTLWLGIKKNHALTALHDHVRSAARRSAIKMESRNFRPHLSLAYLRRDIAKDDFERYLRRYIHFTSKPFLIDQFALYSTQRHKNDPNTYIKEASYPLIG